MSWRELNRCIKFLYGLGKLTLTEVKHTTLEWFAQPEELVKFDNQLLYFQW